MKIRHIPALVLLSCALCWPALGAERDFQALVGAIEQHLGVRHTRIPMLGFAKLFVRASTPSGVHGFELATFEDLRYSPEAMRDFRNAVSNALGESWHPMVQVQAPWRKEYTGIFIKGQGGQFRMMVATIEAREATVIEVRLSPSQWFEWLRSPAKIGQRAGGRDDHDNRCEEE
jgi:hypothetical protein